MNLNGWRRLWVVVSVVWVAGMAWQLTLGPAGTMGEAFLYGSVWLVGPPAVAYLTGLVVAWVVRGFRRPADSITG